MGHDFEVTFSAIGDAPVLPDLLNQIAPQEQIKPVTAGGAYDTRSCHDAIAAKGGVAVMPPRKGTPQPMMPRLALTPSKRLSVLRVHSGANGADIIAQAA